MPPYPTALNNTPYAVGFYNDLYIFFFFFNDTPTTEIYTLSLHDALPIFASCRGQLRVDVNARRAINQCVTIGEDRKSTRLNSSHLGISYAVFCLKKKKTECARQ